MQQVKRDDGQLGWTREQVKLRQRHLRERRQLAGLRQLVAWIPESLWSAVAELRSNAETMDRVVERLLTAALHGAEVEDVNGTEVEDVPGAEVEAVNGTEVDEDHGPAAQPVPVKDSLMREIHPLLSSGIPAAEVARQFAARGVTLPWRGDNLARAWRRWVSKQSGAVQ